jgi:hypothetical protein
MFDFREYRGADGKTELIEPNSADPAAIAIRRVTTDKVRV